jgi:hypothetical protein
MISLKSRADLQGAGVEKVLSYPIILNVKHLTTPYPMFMPEGFPEL